jgi:hypothetical protein
LEALKTNRQKRASAPIGKASEVPDAHELLGEEMKEETTQEFLCGYCHHAFYASMGPVSPAEGNLSIHKGDQAMVGNGYSMCVAAEIAENIFRTAEWPLAVDDPVVAVEFADEGTKGPRV